MSLAELKEKIKLYYPVEPDWSRLHEAYKFAVEAHQGQKRFSGELYITHPLGVSHILAELEMDMDTIVAGLLHDVVEDTEVTLEDIEEKFGEEIAMLVDGVTKLSKLEYKSKEEHQAENLRKMFIAMAKDIRVLLIKLADRTHNMRTLKYLTSIKQQAISRETLEIYAPLAHRLGIYKIKWELEDLAFRFLERDRYYALVDRLAKKRQEREQFIGQIMDSLEPKLEDVGIKAHISGRPKHLYSISQKMKEQGKEFHEIYDLTAIRIIVDSLKDCYGALGIVHTLWKPIPGRFKDYIAMPKPNMYQSLHTLVMVGKNELLEVQIRTWEMHRTAEFGIAAHWRYKEGDVRDDDSIDNKLTWLRQIMELQQDSKDASEFMENVKLDLFADEVFVFTPKGDVIDLPAGSIPLDFAYKIHTDIGHRCIGARVNGRLVPLDYELKTGDIVEVMTAKQGSPSRDWLKMVKSSGARAKIRTWFKKERRDENLSKGKELLEKELRKQDLDPQQYLKTSLLQEAARKFNIQNEEDFYVAIGLGGVTQQQAVSRLKEEYRKKYGTGDEPEQVREFKPQKPGAKKTGKGVSIAGIDNLLIRFAKCCTPVPGDKIVGVVTRGRGVSVHRSDCPNVSVRGENKPHHLEAHWEEQPEGAYPVDIEVTAMDRPQILMDVVNAVSECKVNITALNGRSTKDRMSQIHMTVTVADRHHLDNVINRINRVKDVYRVHRLSG
ncbi:RelA/SpoT family protein [Dethiobacter alkaliphilus]|uniref:RelA/SpoT family protein n=1 Tax=Dethiobacter alkaliphilus TaxID=427926 RepID=UPI0022274D1F|nr:bifunctional (p)ppGpp synthetase/guanosine-3',5'-bis(diphosphate) 3'-pyrophosphohydrolase [Dethiobacter alkaliphilus]MCW3491273.1 bifunctional (p)ppGpp synthetase/guanosine-3',5'-bis(diphosphate) 3'-pyrophosphohydrolase [Dethiobacter alkaliphilus]